MSNVSDINICNIVNKNFDTNNYIGYINQCSYCIQLIHEYNV